MKITLLAVGKVKEGYLREAIAEYEKRLRRYCTLEIIEVADEKAPEKLSEAEMRQVKEREGERLLAKIRPDSYVIALEIQGQLLTSEQLAEKLGEIFAGGNSHIVLVIGGSLGLCEAVGRRADYHLSFSKLTFPHQLMRVIALEQIYRSFRINYGEPYHK